VKNILDKNGWELNRVAKITIAQVYGEFSLPFFR
jgi:hypothetical protein